MYTASELIQVLLGRGRAKLWFRADDQRAPGEFPSPWQAWLDNMAARSGMVTGATAPAIVAIFAARELASPPPRSGELTRWQAFATLWRQQWHTPEPEGRAERIAALVITMVVHVILALLLLWLAYVRFIGIPAPEGEPVVQVEFIGNGTPQDQGGGAPANPTQAPQPAPSAPSRASAARAAAAPAQPPTPASAQPTTQQASPASTPNAEQPLQVTETATPDTTFVLPPPVQRAVDIPQPQLREPQLQTPTTTIELETPAPPLPAVRQLQVQTQTLQVQSQLTQTTTQIPLESPPTPLPPVQQRQVRTPTLSVQAPALNPSNAQIPMPAAATASTAVPAAASAATASNAASPSAAASATPAPSTAGNPVASSSGSHPTASNAGQGPRPEAKPGAWPMLQRGDDWGASTRNRPGGNAGQPGGLFNNDGSVRVPPGTASVGGGLPPGTDAWSMDKIDRNGTWAKYPPNKYTPTMFEKYWVPHETLLEEWVRKGVKSMSIPIPGTSKKINCVVSILQLGGGCGVSDDDMADQEATARPPPEFKLKPALQEDNGSVKQPHK